MKVQALLSNKPAYSVEATKASTEVAINYQRYSIEPIPSGLELTTLDKAAITATQILEVMAAINFISVVEETTENLIF